MNARFLNPSARNNSATTRPLDDAIPPRRMTPAWPTEPAAARPERWCRWSCRRPRPGRTGPSLLLSVITTGSRVRPWRRPGRPCANRPGYRTAPRRGSDRAPRVSAHQLTIRATSRVADQAHSPETWSTPVTSYGEFEGLRLPVRGTAIYKLSGDNEYIEVTITELHDTGAAPPEGRV